MIFEALNDPLWQQGRDTETKPDQLTAVILLTESLFKTQLDKSC